MNLMPKWMEQTLNIFMMIGLAGLLVISGLQATGIVRWDARLPKGSILGRMLGMNLLLFTTAMIVLQIGSHSDLDLGLACVLGNFVFFLLGISIWSTFATRKEIDRYLQETSQTTNVK